MVTLIQGWNSDSPIFKKLIDEVNPSIIIEVGSWKGASTVEMAKYTKAKIYCVDTWLGAVEFYTHPTKERDLMKRDGYPQVYYEFWNNIVSNGLENQVISMPMTSRMGVLLVPKADLIYIDASHEYDDVKWDIENYMKLLKPGGVIFGDDYGNEIFPGVKKAVDEIGGAEIFDNWFWIIRASH